MPNSETEGNATNKSLDMSFIDIQQKLSNRDVLAQKDNAGLNARRSRLTSKTVLLPAIPNDGPDQYKLIMRPHSEHSDEYDSTRKKSYRPMASILDKI